MRLLAPVGRAVAGWRKIQHRRQALLRAVPAVCRHCGARPQQEVIMVSEKAGSGDGYTLLKLAAAERMLASEEQWCKGSLRDRQGRHCMLGALDAVGARRLLAPVVLNAAREIGGKRYWRIESFNDDRSTTHADVLRVLQCAREKIIAEAAEPAAIPRPHEYRRAFCDLYGRAACAIRLRLARAAGGFAVRPQLALARK